MNRTRKLVSLTKTAYLTFDDGPTSNTSRVIQVLDRFKIKASFFVIGNESKLGYKLLRRIVSEGHAIGNHTYSHRMNQMYKSKSSFLKDFYRMQRLLRIVTGKTTKIYRFPGGSNNKIGSKKIIRSIAKALVKKRYVYFDWNIDSLDSRKPFPTPRQIVRKIINEAGSRQQIIILFHDFSRNSVKALPILIRELRKRGYRFDVLSKASYNYQMPL